MFYYYEWLGLTVLPAISVGLYGKYISYRFDKKYPHLSRKALLKEKNESND